MSRKVEGTLILDGMIQGRTTRTEKVEGMLRRWISGAGAQGLAFSLEMEGGNFSVLANNRAVEVEHLGQDPADVICRGLSDLVAELTPPERTDLQSTIRSVEYERNREIQTIYSIDASGKVEPHQRTVKTQTVAPPQKMSRGAMIKHGLVGLLAAALILVISSWFVDYRSFFHKIVEQVVPFDAQSLPVDTSVFSPYFTVKEKTADNMARKVKLTIQRTGAFPKTDADIERLAPKAGTLGERLALEALARGYVRVEYFGKDHKFLSCETIRVADLRDKPEIVLELPLPVDESLTAVTISY